MTWKRVGSSKQCKFYINVELVIEDSDKSEHPDHSGLKIFKTKVRLSLRNSVNFTLFRSRTEIF